MDCRTPIQKRRDERNEKIKRLFVQYKSKASKCRAAEMVAEKLNCSKSTVINALAEQGQWK